MLSDVGAPAINRDTTFTLCPFFLQSPRRPAIPGCQGSLWVAGRGGQGWALPARVGGWQVRGRSVICHPYLLLVYTRLPVNTSLNSHLTTVR